MAAKKSSRRKASKATGKSTSRSVGAKTIARDCTAMRLRLINRAITSVYDDALRPFGLRISQLNLLVVISSMNEAKPSDLVPLLQMEASTLSRNIERMKRQGWIDTLADKDDGRGHLVKMTAKGEKLVKAASEAWKKAQSETADILGADGVKAIGRVAERFWAENEA